jgi:DeoR family transcriptional regulator of aga operon
MSAPPAARRAAILDVLTKNGFVAVSSLQERLRCSEATVRRDLHQLERDGYLRRTHGGAILDGYRERPLTTKMGEMAEAKQAIAQIAVSLIGEGQAIGFTGGTTTQHVARVLVSRPGLTVVTNAVNVAMELASRDMRVIITGGELRSETYELVGPLAEPVASQIHLDLIVVGVDGLSPEGGLTTHNPIEARIDRVLIDRASRVVVVADHTKLGRNTFAQIAPLDAAHTLITDAGANPEMVQEIERAGVAVIIAQAER